MLDLWKRQFSREKFFMRHPNPHIFLKSQWQRDGSPNVMYVFYRWILTAFLFGTWLLSVIDPKHLDKTVHFRAKWVIYLTNWGYSLCFVQSFLCSICVTIWYIKSRKSKDPESYHSVWTTGPYRIYWVLNAVATDVAFGITVLYWALIYDETKMEVDAQNVFVHGTNSVVMFIDLFVVAHPLYLVQCYWSVLFGLLYIIFSIIYYACGGTSRNEDQYIYPVLDWGKPATTGVVCVLVLIFLVILHVFACCMQVCRKQLDKKVRKRKYSTDVTKSSLRDGFDNIAASNDVV